MRVRGNDAYDFGSTSQSSSNTGGRKLPPPTELNDIAREVTLQVCRKYLFVNIYWCAAYYFALTLCLSLLSPMFSFIEGGHYFSQRHNLINQYFVKLGWGWAFVLGGSFSLLSSYVTGGGRPAPILRSIGRLLVATGVWYFVTQWFVHFETTTGTCRGYQKAMNHRECEENQGHWLPGFDISGHCFLLIFCCMFLNEESRAFRDWERLRSIVSDPDGNKSALLQADPAAVRSTRQLHSQHTLAVKYLFVALALLHLIWDFSLVMTLLYFHTPAQKLVGAGIALACWFGTYQLWYRMRFSPGQPTTGQSSMDYHRSHSW